MAAILTALLDSLEANVPGTVRDIDTEFLHDLRIAVRWTRSALKLCGSALPDGLLPRFRPEFRWLGDLTTPTSDLDVYLLGFAEWRRGSLAPPRSSWPRSMLIWCKSRAGAYRQLARGLRSARFARLTADWRAALAAVRRGPQASHGRAARRCPDRRSPPQGAARGRADHRAVPRAEPA